MRPFAALTSGACLCLLTFPGAAPAQKWVNPNFDTHRLDYRDLGYPAASELDPDDSPVTSLLTHSSGKVYGATSGRRAYLFLYDRTINKVRPLGLIPGAQGVYHSLVEGRDGMVYLGTGLNVLEEVPLTSDFPGGQRAVEEQLWKDVRAPYEDYPGGHLYRYDPAEDDARACLPEDTCRVADLGVPVPGNTVYALGAGCDRAKLYGISYPDAHFFVFDLQAGKSRDLGEPLSRRVYSGPERAWRSVPRGLVCTPDGRVYTSGDDGLIVRYDPQEGCLTPTAMRLPGEYWEVWNYYGYPVAECFARDSLGRIFGGTSDGFVFMMDPAREKLVNLGKPRLSRRVRAMSVGLDNRLYLVCGQLQEPCKLYSYDLCGQDGFTDLGVLAVDRSPYYAKRPYQFDSMTTGVDGTVFIGESERRAKLFLYVPGPGAFEEGLNPSNPR